MSRPWKMTRHAAERIMDMCVPPQVVRECLEYPDHTYEQTYRGDIHAAYKDAGRKVLCKGKLVLVVAPETRYIVTAMWDGLTLGEYARSDKAIIWKEGGWIDY